MDRALASEAKGPGFESRIAHHLHSIITCYNGELDDWSNSPLLFCGTFGALLLLLVCSRFNLNKIEMFLS